MTAGRWAELAGWSPHAADGGVLKMAAEDGTRSSEVKSRALHKGSDACELF